MLATKESPIQAMPDHARLWVYQSSRPFTKAEISIVSDYLQTFVGEWAAHGNQLLARFSIEHDQFIVIAVDESFNQASGCSIDASVGVIRNIEQQLNVSLLDRSQIAYLSGETVHLIPFNQVKAEVLNGNIQSDTIIFNNAVQTAGEWKQGWKVEARDSWLKRHFD